VSFSGTRGAFLLPTLAILTLCCSREEPPGIRRMAILRFENLTGDDALNWLGRAASEVVAAELAASGTISIIGFHELHASDRVLGPRPPAAPGISAERPAALFAGAGSILYGRVSRVGPDLRLDAVLFDTSRGKWERAFAANGPESQGVIRLADQLAKQVAAPVRTFGTRAEGALHPYCDGLESADPSAAQADFARAVAADANFGEAYLAWAQLAAEQNNRAEAQHVLELAAGRGKAIPALERARIAALAAELRGDLQGAMQALETVARLDPTDAGTLRKLAQANLSARRYSEAAQNFKAALAVERDNPELWNGLGYAEMFAGDLTAAATALDEYRRIRPADANALDSLGDVHFYFGRFTAAEQYYRQAFQMNPGFEGGGPLLKAAHARLRTGDIGGADALFHQYLEVRQSAKDPLVELRRAEWEFLTGRKSQAIARLEGFARRMPPEPAAGLASQVYTQLAVWELELGDRTRAREFAGQAQGAQASGWVARFLTGPPAPPAEWKHRAMELLPRPEDERTREWMLGCALLLQKEFQAAVPVLSDLYQHSAPEPHEILPVLLAWAQLETGDTGDAARLVQRNPVPAAAADIFATLAFPRLLMLRAAVLEKEGKDAEAASARRLFVSLSGPGDTR
jgi:tetratricopeptide (TPR) repeat protein/TolB-like protein